MEQLQLFGPSSYVRFSDQLGDTALFIRPILDATPSILDVKPSLVERHVALSVNEVVSHGLISKTALEQYVRQTYSTDVDINVKMERIYTFKENTNCVKCGREGSVFFVERHAHDPNQQHFGFYSIDGAELVLMTVDHILPESLGGRYAVGNFRTMCCKCNGKRANCMSVKEINLVLSDMDRFAKPWVDRELLRTLLNLQITIYSMQKRNRKHLEKLFTKYARQIKHCHSADQNKIIVNNLKQEISKITQPVVVPFVKESWIVKVSRSVVRGFQRNCFRLFSFYPLNQ